MSLQKKDVNCILKVKLRLKKKNNKRKSLRLDQNDSGGSVRITSPNHRAVLLPLEEQVLLGIFGSSQKCHWKNVQGDFWEQSRFLDLRFHSQSNRGWCILSCMASLLAVMPSQGARLIGTLFLGYGGQWMRPCPSDPLTHGT